MAVNPVVDVYASFDASAVGKRYGEDFPETCDVLVVTRGADAEIPAFTSVESGADGVERIMTGEARPCWMFSWIDALVLSLS